MRMSAALIWSEELVSYYVSHCFSQSRVAQIFNSADESTKQIIVNVL